MLFTIVDYLFSSPSSPSTPPAEDVPSHAEDVECDGWVMTEARSEEEFAFVENPQILEVDDDDDDDMIGLAEQVVERNVASEAVRRREEFNRAKAKKASIMHMEAVMFACPISGKDVRTNASGRCIQSSSPTTTTVVRRVNASSSGGTQRAKKTSGKSNDRKVHKACDIHDPFA